MMIPIRCMSCAKPVAHLWEGYTERVKNGEERKKILDEIGLKRFCCRALFLGHIDLIDTVAQFKKSQKKEFFSNRDWIRNIVEKKTVDEVNSNKNNISIVLFCRE